MKHCYAFLDSECNDGINMDVMEFISKNKKFIISVAQDEGTSYVYERSERLYALKNAPMLSLFVAHAKEEERTILKNKKLDLGNLTGSL